MKPTPTRAPRIARGVSLIEALVALAIMGFGMLAVVGVQATLRSTSSFSGQRAEAVRLAQQAVESWRSIRALEADSTALDYTDLITDTGAAQIEGTTATYALTRTIANIGGQLSTGEASGKSLSVRVTWRDRAGQDQSVDLATVIAGVSPELGGTLAIPPMGTPGRLPGGRARNIPPASINLGNGLSAFKPPQPTGSTVSWVFNNVTGLIKGICTGLPLTPTAADVASCSNNTTAQLVSGYVNFAATASQPGEAEAETPTGQSLNFDVVLTTTAPTPLPSATCFDDSSPDGTQALVRSRVAYYCAVTSPSSGLWAGRTRIQALGFTTPTATTAWSIASTAAVGNYKVCRYTPLSADTGTLNTDHPLDYSNAASAGAAYASLIDQNFLVISASHICPADSNIDPLNANTRLHQDGSSTYSNP